MTRFQAKENVLSMKQHVFLYGLIGGVFVVVLRLIEYRYLVIEHSIEIYGGLVAAVFAGVGIWIGLRLTRARTTVVETVVVREVPVPVREPFVRDDAAVAVLGITPRELGILELIAVGLSTKEIAERIFVSENTVRTHASRLFDNLGAKRRRQAVQLGRRGG
ncbi:MAG TPA: helix-turn-helix transcriptional regulator [Gemmatimonadaceae bacterium]|nr:helix-turn-helix transcriptional regulator [Gemmatimonadaceae bacterium]